MSKKDVLKTHTTRSRLKVDYKLTREVKSQLLKSRILTYI